MYLSAQLPHPTSARTCVCWQRGSILGAIWRHIFWKAPQNCTLRVDFTLRLHEQSLLAWLEPIYTGARAGLGLFSRFFYSSVLNFRFYACLARFAQEYCHPNSTRFCLNQNQGSWQHLFRAVNYTYRENCRLCCPMACTWISVVETKERKANPS